MVNYLIYSKGYSCKTYILWLSWLSGYPRLLEGFQANATWLSSLAKVISMQEVFGYHGYQVDWGRLYKLLDVLLDASICSLGMIGTAILKSGHPYIWVRYHEPINI